MKLLLTVFFICFHSSGASVLEAYQKTADEIGKQFLAQYYTWFDDPAQRHHLVNLYNANDSFMTYHGALIQGAPQIMEKISSLPFQRVAHIITYMDCQPMFQWNPGMESVTTNGILINVLGQLKIDDDDARFSQTFVLKPRGDSIFIQHDIFRMDNSD